MIGLGLTAALIVSVGVWFYFSWGPISEDGIQSEVLRVSHAHHDAAIIVATISEGNVHTYSAGNTGTVRSLDDQTIFEIGSLSKLFAGTLLASDVITGSLRLDEPVRTLLPDFAIPSHDGAEITLEELATHHSGLPKLPTNLNLDAPDVYALYTPGDLREYFKTAKLETKPGTKYLYSNVAYGLLGYALSVHDRASYAQLVRSRITEPLGMSDTKLDPSLMTLASGRMARGFDENGNVAPYWHVTEAISGAGGYVSTASDMLAFLKANMTRGSLDGALDFAQRPRADSDYGRVGLGWETSQGYLWKNGQTAGYHAFIGMTRDHRYGIVLLANVGSFDLDYMPMRVLMYR